MAADPARRGSARRLLSRARCAFRPWPTRSPTNPSASVPDPNGGGPAEVPCRTRLPDAGNVPKPREPERGLRRRPHHYAYGRPEAGAGKQLARIVVSTLLRFARRGRPSSKSPTSPAGSRPGSPTCSASIKAADTNTRPRLHASKRRAAIVLSNTPTYTYAPTDPSQGQLTARPLRRFLMRYGVSAVVSGRLGWNAFTGLCSRRLPISPRRRL